MWRGHYGEVLFGNIVKRIAELFVTSGTFSAKFVPKSSYFSTESAKFGAFKRDRKKLKIFKLIVEILKA